METILTAIDFSASSRAAAQVGLRLARAAGAELILLHVSDWDTAWGARLRVEGMAAALAGQWTRISPRVAEGDDPPSVIRRTARTEQADLVVVGTHARSGLPRFFLGSVAESLVRHAACPVIVVRRATPELPAEARPRVIAALDLGAPGQESVVSEATRLAILLGGRVELVHAVPSGGLADPVGLADRLHLAGAPIRSAGVDLGEHLLDGDPAQAVLEAAEDFGASYLVLGTHAREGASRLIFGSVAESVLRRAPCPVLVTRHGMGRPLQVDPVRVSSGVVPRFEGLATLGEVS